MGKKARQDYVRPNCRTGTQKPNCSKNVGTEKND